MPELSYDLHIHSCLSPCGDNASTPADIAGMAALKGLDVIALTDHNSCRNCPAFLTAADYYGILALPGMELTTEEEVHAVCLFPTLEAAMDFDSYVYERLMKVKNKESIFGEQLIYGTDESIIGREPYLLLNATSIPFDDVYSLAESFGGVMFPAHIDKEDTSLLSNLGFIPEDSLFRTAEVKYMDRLPDLRADNPYLNDCLILHNSDAHYFPNINDPGLKIHVEEKSPAGVIDAIRRGIS